MSQLFWSFGGSNRTSTGKSYCTKNGVIPSSPEMYGSSAPGRNLYVHVGKYYLHEDTCTRERRMNPWLKLQYITPESWGCRCVTRVRKKSCTDQNKSGPHQAPSTMSQRWCESRTLPKTQRRYRNQVDKHSPFCLRYFFLIYSQRQSLALLSAIGVTKDGFHRWTSMCLVRWSVRFTQNIAPRLLDHLGSRVNEARFFSDAS